MKGSYTIMQGWMFKILNLSGNEVIVYAIIYNFTQKGNVWLEEYAVNYITRFTNLPENLVVEILEDLTEGGFIKKVGLTTDGEKKYGYEINHDLVPQTI